LLCVRNAEAEAGPHEDRLLKRFFHDNKYYATSRPVADDSDSVVVKFGVVSLKTFELVNIYYTCYYFNTIGSCKTVHSFLVYATVNGEQRQWRRGREGQNLGEAIASPPLNFSMPEEIF